MNEIFLKALDKLTDPVAIIALLLMSVNLALVLAVIRHLPRLYETLGRQAAILEHLVYNHNSENEFDDSN